MRDVRPAARRTPSSGPASSSSATQINLTSIDQFGQRHIFVREASARRRVGVAFDAQGCHVIDAVHRHDEAEIAGGDKPAGLLGASSSATFLAAATTATFLDGVLL